MECGETTVTKEATANRVHRPATKLWIIDCLRISPNPKVQNTYLFQDFVIQYVDVFGVVTGRKFMGTSAAIYTVDDGTGVITCVYDHERPGNREDYENIKKLANELANVPGFTKLEHKLLSYMMKPAVETYENLIQYRNVGDTVHVVGRLCEYKDLRQVKAYYMSLVTDLNDEVDRIHELVLLYENGYNKIKC